MIQLHKHLVLFLFLALFPHTLYGAEPAATKTYSSVEERRIDSALEEERAKFRKEREDIAIRKKELKTLEEGVDKKLSQIDGKLEELRTLQKKIESLLADKTAKEKKRIKELATIYQKMSPAKAALVITGLDEKLATDLLAGMKVKSAAKILDQISKQKAADLSTTFTTIKLE